MTAVAKIQKEGLCPILIGDLLLTVDPKYNYSPIRIPSQDDNNIDLKQLLKDAEGTPSGLTQKLCMPASNLILGWSDSRRVAEDFFKKLRSKIRDDCISLDDLIQTIGLLKSGEDRDKLQLTGFLIEGRCYSIGYKSGRFDFEQLGPVDLIGSGSPDVYQSLENVCDSFNAGETQNPVKAAIGLGLFVTNQLLGLEVTTAKSLKSAFGVGYELAYVSDGRIQKLSGVSYIIWQARIVGKDDIRISQFPSHIFSNEYWDEILLLRSIPVDTDRGLINKELQSLHLVTPFHVDVSDIDLRQVPLPSINQKWQCFYFLVSLPNGQYSVLNQIEYQGNGPRKLDIRTTGNGLTLSFEKSFLEGVARKIASYGEVHLTSKV